MKPARRESVRSNGEWEDEECGRRKGKESRGWEVGEGKERMMSIPRVSKSLQS